MIRVRVSGETRCIEDGATVASLVGEPSERGLAVARNGEVVRRDEWQTTVLCDGDEVEVVRPIQGGAT